MFKALMESIGKELAEAGASAGKSPVKKELP
jgi:hypothetical protein